MRPYEKERLDVPGVPASIDVVWEEKPLDDDEYYEVYFWSVEDGSDLPEEPHVETKEVRHTLQIAKEGRHYIVIKTSKTEGELRRFDVAKKTPQSDLNQVTMTEDTKTSGSKRDPIIKVTYPSDGSLFYTKGVSYQVPFNFVLRGRDSPKNQYVLQIEGPKNLKLKVKHNTQISVKLPPGEYTWSVTAATGGGKLKFNSFTYNLRISNLTDDVLSEWQKFQASAVYLEDI